MFFTSALQRAIKCGLADGGDLSEELRQLKNYPIRSKQDAQAICNALDKLMERRLEMRSCFGHRYKRWLGYFKRLMTEAQVHFRFYLGKDCLVLCMLVEREMESVQEDGADTLLFALKILAMYRTHEDRKASSELPKCHLSPMLICGV